ncbi:MAG: hypothetical protein HQL45_15785 [Alphaproteobacteria bacterium]|nr:hypothetical protein [Alphaproteobacteria bacterium]
MNFPDTLAEFGRLLYGDRWQSALADEVVKINDRTMRRWIAGTEHPRDQDEVIARCRAALARRIADLLLISLPPRPETPNADNLIGEALSPLLAQILAASVDRGWHPAETLAATLSWLASALIDGVGEAEAAKLLRQSTSLIERHNNNTHPARD